MYQYVLWAGLFIGCADMQITVETYKIFLEQVTCIFSQDHGEGFQHTLPPKMNVHSLEQQTQFILVY